MFRFIISRCYVAVVMTFAVLSCIIRMITSNTPNTISNSSTVTTATSHVSSIPPEFSTLPDVMQIMILTYIPPLALVKKAIHLNKKIRTQLQSQQFRKNYNFELNGSACNDVNKKKMKESMIERLCTNAFLVPILQYVRVHHFNANPSISFINTIASHLHSLQLYHCCINENDFDNAVLYWSQHTMLTALYIANCTTTTSSSSSSSSQNPTIRFGSRLSNFRKLCGMVYVNLTNTDIPAKQVARMLLRSQKTLRTLLIRNTPIEEALHRLFFRFMSVIQEQVGTAANVNHMQTIDIEARKSLLIIGCCERLEHLDISGKEEGVTLVLKWLYENQIRLTTLEVILPLSFLFLNANPKVRFESITTIICCIKVDFEIQLDNEDELEQIEQEEEQEEEEEEEEEEDDDDQDDENSIAIATYFFYCFPNLTRLSLYNYSHNNNANVRVVNSIHTAICNLYNHIPAENMQIG